MPSSNPSVTIIIVTYNSGKFLNATLRSIASNDYYYTSSVEVIVVDNNSSDNTLEVLEKAKKTYKTDVVTIRLRKNVGFAKACNIGALASKGKYLFFLNPDVVLSNSTIRLLVEFLDNNTDVGVVQPKILSYDGTRIDSAGGFMDFLGHGYHRGFNEPYQGQYNEITDIMYASFAAAMVRRELYLKLGGLRPEYFVYGEDLDFSWRVWISGYRVVYYPYALVYHMGGHSTRKLKYLTLFNTRKNRLETIFTNYLSLRNALTATIILSIFYLLGSFIGLIKHNKEDTLSFINALRWFYRNINSISIRRKQVATLKKIIDDSYLFKKKLVSMKLKGAISYLLG